MYFMMFLLIILWVHIVTGISDPVLLFANRGDIRFVDLYPPRGNDVKFSKGIEDAAAVDFDYARGDFCWIDISLEEIRCNNVAASTRSKPRRLVYQHIQSPDGLALDWVTGNLYWTDSDSKRIEVTDRRGRYRRGLFWLNLDQPRAIAVLPSDGLMFWTDWGDVPKIEVAGMDGDPASRRVFVKDDVVWPNGITIDYETKMVYWTDANKQQPHISMQRLDGTGRQLIVSNISQLAHPFSVSVYGAQLLWTDLKTQSIHATDKTSGGAVSTVLAGDGGLQPLDLHVYSAVRQPAVPSACADSTAGCDQLCLLAAVPSSAQQPRQPQSAPAAAARPGYTCACATGVRQINNTHCAQRHENVILLAQRGELRVLSLDTDDRWDYKLPLKSTRSVLAVDYDPVQDEIYWTDDETRSIERAGLPWTGSVSADTADSTAAPPSRQRTVLNTAVHSPGGIAVDWIARNVHWTDTGSNRIEVARISQPLARKVLVSADVDEPRAIVLDPVAGFMYWSDWGEKRPKIERAALDGSRRQVLVDTSIRWPNGIALDLLRRRLYWCDADRDRIEVANMDGSGRRVLVSKNLPHLFGISLHGDYIYWSDWMQRTVERVHKISGDERQVIADNLADLMGLKAVTRSEALGTNQCAFRNGNCSHLCLNTPAGRVCSCPIGMELVGDLRSCVIPEAFLLFTQNRTVRRIGLETPRQQSLLPVRDVNEAGALDFNMLTQQIYWTDVGDQSISRAHVNGSQQHKIVQLDAEFPEGLSVDWMAGNVYWVTAVTARIEVSRLDGTDRRVLLWGGGNHPRVIAVDSTDGYLFWSDWSTEGSIYRAELDCGDAERYVTDVGRVGGLTVDTWSGADDGRLYWVDTDRRRIESVPLTAVGPPRRRLLLDALAQPYALAVSERHVYWADWTLRHIERADKLTGANRTVVLTDAPLITDLVLFHRRRPAAWSPCAVDVSGRAVGVASCAQLCFGRPPAVVNAAVAGVRATYRCSCRSHYTLQLDRVSCAPPVEFLLFVQRNNVHRHVLAAGDVPDVTLPVTGVYNSPSISYDPNNRHIYWIDAKTRAVRRSRDDFTALHTFLQSEQLAIRPHTLQIDPYSGVLFWSCSEQDVVNVTRLNGSLVGAVVGGDRSADKPRHIALMPSAGLLVWTNVAAPVRIEVCGSDGSQRRVLVDSQLEFPSALTADDATRLVYWADRHKIWMTDLQRQKRVLVETGIQEVRGLAVLGQHLYWLDPAQQLLESVDKRSGQDRHALVSRAEALSAILAVSHISRNDIVRHPCYGNGLCSHLCVATDGRGSRCACPLGLRLQADGRTCRSPQHCPSDQFACPSGRPTPCISQRLRCDGRAHCVDGADERGCPVCGDGLMPCPSAPGSVTQPTAGHCIAGTLACDGRRDCPVDGFDELICCEPAQFFCQRSRECVSLTLLCDGRTDCRSGEDEWGAQCVSDGSRAGLTDGAGVGPGASSALLAVVSVLAALGVCSVVFVVWWCRCRTRRAHDKQPTAVPPSSHQLQLHERHGSRRASGRRDSMPLSQLPAHRGGPAIVQLPYEPRPHVTGASSSDGSGRYPCEPLNPPPSPATTGGQPPSLASYRYYKLRNRPPPPTPCSTDVCDSDSATYYAYRGAPGRLSAGVGDSDYDSEPTYGAPMGGGPAHPQSPPSPPPAPPPSVAARASTGHSRRPHRPGAPPPSPVNQRYVV